MCVSEEYQQKLLWRQKHPAVIAGLLAFFQCILHIVIVGCEVGITLIHFEKMNAFIGYATFANFLCAWVSLAGASCCCRTRCCAITTVVFQLLSIPASICIIGFDAYFLQNPLKCFFSDDCSSYYSNYYGNYNQYNYYLNDINSLYNIKIPLVRGQLAAGVLMLVSSIIYFLIYGITSHKVSNAVNITSHSQPIQSQSFITTIETPTKQITCPHCQTKFSVTTKY